MVILQAQPALLKYGFRFKTMLLGIQPAQSLFMDHRSISPGVLPWKHRTNLMQCWSMKITHHFALCYNASSAMINAYGAGDEDTGTKMFLTWYIFGDPTINVAPPCFLDLPIRFLNLQE